MLEEQLVNQLFLATPFRRVKSPILPFMEVLPYPPHPQLSAQVYHKLEAQIGGIPSASQDGINLPIRSSNQSRSQQVKSLLLVSRANRVRGGQKHP